MTTTLEILASQLGGLTLHQGDSLRVLDEREDKLLVRIDRAQQVQGPKMTATEWVKKYAGILELKEGETIDDLRLAHMREKYGVE